MTLAIGITGGIGSGKSTVCNVFRILGIPVFEADVVAKQLLNSDDNIKNALIALFGNSIYSPSGKLHREKLATIIFHDKALLEKVNNLVHPAVREEYGRWLAQKKEFKYIIHEAAILFESGFYKMMDFTILVTAPEDQRIARVMKRDGTTEAMVKERMKNQWPEEKKISLAYLTLENDNKKLMIPQIISIDEKLKKHGKIW
jgi:dephospho-CoA kinase